MVEEFSKGHFTVIFSESPGSLSLAKDLVALLSHLSESEKKKCDGINLIITNSEYLFELNKKYRGIEKSTDVLSFNLSDSQEESITGEIYINLYLALQNAKKDKYLENLTLEERFRHELFKLSLHGFLHLCGWEHPDDVSLQEMISRGEKEIKWLKEWKRIGN